MLIKPKQWGVDEMKQMLKPIMYSASVKMTSWCATDLMIEMLAKSW